MPNTAMLGAFTAATGLVDMERLLQDIAQTFGTINCTAAEKAAASIQIHRL
jgi:Pyruvate/2-oxoacid:ferredoxin oxidoreductase gamma subunit